MRGLSLKRLAFFLSAWCLGGSSASAQEAPVAPAQPRAVTAPVFISGPAAEYSEAERNAGHHGTVVIAGMLGIDGRFRDPIVEVSSGAPGLDAAALAAARESLFTPARDAAGAPVEIRARMPFRFSRAATPGGGLTYYLCGAFAQDMTWWRATFPERRWGDHELYQLLYGMGVLSSGALEPGGQRRLRQYGEDFERRWQRAIEACRARPNVRLLDVLPLGGRNR
jgi:TonB family protein